MNLSLPSMEAGQAWSTFPVTIRSVQYDEHDNPKALCIEESIGIEGRNTVLFPPKWKGLENWPGVKAENFREVITTPGIKVQIEVDSKFVLSMVASENYDYHIEPDDYHDYFNTTSTTSTTTKKSRNPNAVPLQRNAFSWDEDSDGNTVIPMLKPLDSKKQKTESLQSKLLQPLRPLNNNHQPISLSISIKKGQSVYKKSLDLNENASFATIDFLSKLLDAYKADSFIIEAMLREFEHM